MLTKSDLKQIAEINNDLKNELEKINTNLEKKFENKVTEFKDEILHEIKGLREEVAIVTGYKDEIEDHDYRIEKLEKKVFPQV